MHVERLIQAVGWGMGLGVMETVLGQTRGEQRYPTVEMQGL